MRIALASASILLLLNACGSGEDRAPERNSAGEPSGAEAAAVNPSSPAPAGGATGATPANRGVVPQATLSAGKEPAAPQPEVAVKNGSPEMLARQGSPCTMQDGKSLPATRLRATGTEPFWSARIEGRCVTYSHPEDQEGTRIWTQHTPARTGGSWSGKLGGSAFELRVRPEAGCSDGMSDKEYPLAADLTLNGERRRGCAEPL